MKHIEMKMWRGIVIAFLVGCVFTLLFMSDFTKSYVGPLSVKSTLEVTQKELEETSNPSAMTALWDEIKHKQREFQSEYCKQTYTVASLSAVFSAHSVEWSMMGKERAWWSVLTNYEQVPEIPEAEKVKFYQSGVDDVQGNFITGESSPVEIEMRSTGEMGSVLDFGCGLGRMAFALAKHFQEVTCVDQSVFHLRTAKEEWQKRKSPGDAEVSFVVSSPDLLSAVQGKRFDVVHTVVVMQHMAAPLQQVYLEQFCDVLKPGGRGWVHIPIDIKGKGDHCDLEGSIKEGGMQMHSTPAHAIERFMSRRGCDVHLVDVGDWGIGGGMTAGLVHFKKRADGSQGKILPMALAKCDETRISQCQFARLV